jgi:hypothetical protein
MLRFRFCFLTEIISDGRLTSAPMRPQTCGKETAGLFSTEGLAAWLRSRYPFSTGAHVEADTGIPTASVENWLQYRSRPSIEHFATLCMVYGPAMLLACFRRPSRWIQYAAQAERAREIEAEMARLAQERKQLKDVA